MCVLIMTLKNTIGLKRKSTPDEFIDYFDPKKDCKYLKGFNEK